MVTQILNGVNIIILRATLFEMLQMPKPRVNCVIQPRLLPTGGTFIITGYTAIGKSTTAMQMAYDIATGQRLLGIFPVKRLPVLYVELEKRDEEVIEKFQKFAPAYQAKDPDFDFDISYTDQENIQLDKDIGKQILLQAIMDFGAKVAIIDSFAMMQSDESENAYLKKSLQNLKDIAVKTRTSFIMVHHLNKESISFDQHRSQFVSAPITLNSMRGGSVFQYMVDTVITVEYNTPSTRTIRFLKHSRCPIDLIHLTPKLVFGWKPDLPIPVCPEEFKVTALLDIVHNKGVISLSDLDTELGISRPTTRKLVDRCVQIGLIREVPKLGADTFIETINYD